MLDVADLDTANRGGDLQRWGPRGYRVADRHRPAADQLQVRPLLLTDRKA
ncbi:hypothetical protein [Nocardia bovistercoris]|uniref:Uncharacterized protein n=1 Tax=Nocardia bovistercoris TaxID=2785916 RepID=A0A931IHV8_9NOCA|nr:hypothetical protein [Nocardia bovistercoris]MBH0781706.1 hypothetical protein [Nocardia bovistercoris]